MSVASLLNPFLFIQDTNAQSNTYYCGKATHSQNGEVPATLIKTHRGEIALIYWINDLGNFNPQERCEKVSNNLQAS